MERIKSLLSRLLSLGDQQSHHLLDVDLMIDLTKDLYVELLTEQSLLKQQELEIGLDLANRRSALTPFEEGYTAVISNYQIEDESDASAHHSLLDSSEMISGQDAIKAAEPLVLEEAVVLSHRPFQNEAATDGKPEHLSMAEPLVEHHLENGHVTEERIILQLDEPETIWKLNVIEPEYSPSTPADRSLRQQPNKDIRSLISINDKYIYLQELFRHDVDAYHDTLPEVNNFSSEEDALRWINAAIADNYGWEEDSEAVQLFYKLLHDYFTAR
jgi:hypothetical protein